MELFDKQTIYGCVRMGRSRADAVVLQGAPLTAEQKVWWREASLLLQSDKAKARLEAEKKPRMSVAENMRRLVDRENTLERREPEDPARRKRLEKDPVKWLRYYFPNIFYLPFSDGHRAIIDAVVRTDAHGKNMVVAAPRGEGKTNILRFMSLYLVFTGRARFVVVGG